jgi:hypothetical protein
MTARWMPADPLQILIHISRILDGLGVTYLTGGSIASSLMEFHARRRILISLSISDC